MGNSDLDLDALAELERKATEGPWETVANPRDWLSPVRIDVSEHIGIRCVAKTYRGGNSTFDAAFISAVRNHARALIAEARRARELVHYAMHEEDCPRSYMTDAEGDCSCGLSALLRREDERG